MKKFVSMATMLTLALALCACNSGGNPGTTPTPSKSTQASPSEPPQVPTSEPTQEQDGKGDIIDDPIPAGADDVIMQGVFYYELAEMSGDYGDGLSPREGAELANDLLTNMGLYRDNGIPDGQCVYISLDELAVLDSAMGRECYIYSVGLGTAEGGLMGDGYKVIYRVSVDYSGKKTAAIYDDLSGE